VKLKTGFVFILFIVGLVGANLNVAWSQSVAVLRDSEIEKILRQWSDPIFELAGLDPRSVTVRLIDDISLNAFVAGGQNIFLNTGLLLSTDSPLQVIGVIAHETGHISGGHIARSEEAVRQSQTLALLHTLLGIGALAVGGAVGSASSVDAAGALLTGSAASGLRHFLKFSRTQETAADQAALTLLEANKTSARGLLSFLRKFEDQDLLSPSRQDPYTRSHPLTSARIEFVANHIETSAFSQSAVSARDLERHARLRAKLIGFLQPVEQTLRLYPVENQSIPARYARAIGYYRDSDIGSALREIDGLISEQPGDPYFHELRGQFLFESGRLREAWPSYELANKLLPGDTLLMCELARLEIEIGDAELINKAIASLERVVVHEPRNNAGWWLLSIGYGRAGRLSDSALASAEQALLEGRSKDALLHAGRAIRGFETGSPSWLRANDVEQLVRRKTNE
jgi:predicted Zn-dependent protease